MVGDEKEVLVSYCDNCKARFVSSEDIQVCPICGNEPTLRKVTARSIIFASHCSSCNLLNPPHEVVCRCGANLDPPIDILAL